MTKAFRWFATLTIGGLLAASLVFKFADPTPNLYPDPKPVASLEDARDATIGLLCREKKTNKPLMTGSGARLYSPRDGKWMIATAAHVTANCTRMERMVLEIGPSDDDEDSGPGVFGIHIRTIVYEGNLYAVYHHHEYKVSTKAENQFSDTSLIMTDKKIPGAFSYFKLREKVNYYQQPVIAIGYPAGFSYPSWDVMMTYGHISNPLVSREHKLKEFGPSEIVLYIISDVKIYFGNSGGPLIDSDFHLMGLNVAMDEGRFSFTAPVSYIKKQLKDLKYHEEVYP